ncbi:hypothetical protein L6164_030600 [Bauhinia variegata]|uniref:Uncharacterized protein n=1 Tax=Bauhinia variegata TaxID=167791 RepID=A0ACB9LCA7_BAUVA|nr:hypothetical protein L6164_030600 [Bauhinia variegata]
MVELASIVEAKDMFVFLGEELLGPDKKLEKAVALDDAFKVWDTIGFGLNELGSRALLLFAFLLELFWGFGDKEGGGEWGSEEGKVGFNRIRIRADGMTLCRSERQG